MKNNFVRKFTEREVNKNSSIINDFAHAFSSFDVEDLMSLLHENGCFFNGYNKGRTYGIFRKMIHGANGIKSRNCMQFNRGISLTIFPGQEVLEIRCYNEDLDFYSGKNHVIRTFGQPADPSIQEIVYRFVFRFQDFKIIEIKMATRSIENVEKLIIKN